MFYGDRSGSRGRTTTSQRRDSSGTTRRDFLGASGATAVTALAGCVGDSASDTPTNTTGSPENGPEEVIIGSIHPLTGSTSYTGTRCYQAVKLAAMIANENGGIDSMNGAEVRVVSRDHKNDPSRAAEAVDELVNEGADILTGTYSSRVTSSVATAAEGEGIPFVIDVSTAASILQERDFNYVYRTQPNSNEMAKNTVNHTLTGAREAGFDANTAGLFYIDVTYGQSISKGLRKAVDNVDLEIIAEETIGFGETADSQVTALRAADPDILFPTVFPSQFMELIGAMNDQDYWPPIFSGAASAGFTPTNFQKVGEIINGALATGYRLDPTSQRVRDVSQRFADTFDTAPMANNQGMSFATAQAMLAAFEAAGSTDPDVLNQTLQDIRVTDHVMAMPPIEFREDGENANALAVTAQVQDLLPKLVFPDQFAVTEVNTDTLVSN